VARFQVMLQMIGLSALAEADPGTLVQLLALHFGNWSTCDQPRGDDLARVPANALEFTMP